MMGKVVTRGCDTVCAVTIRSLQHPALLLVTLRVTDDFRVITGSAKSLFGGFVLILFSRVGMTTGTLQSLGTSETLSC